MKLNLSQIRDVTMGAVRVEEIDNEIHFYRFTKSQEDLYFERSNQLKNNFYLKTFSTSGVQMRFRTNSQSLGLTVNVSEGSTRKYFAVEVLVNGERIDAVKNFSEEALSGNYTKWEFPLGNFSETFDLGDGEKEVRIRFPWSVVATMKEFVLDDGSFITPVKSSKKLLCFGDSITHGYDVLYPGNKYATKLADALDAQEYNKAIGGEIFFPELAETREDFDPDYIIVAYGTNDWSRCTEEKLACNCKAFLYHVSHNYPNAKIFVTTPIWRKDMNATKPFGDFMHVGEVIAEQAVGLENVSVIQGFGFVPPDEALFADLQLHPNDKGFESFFEKLLEEIKGITGEKQAFTPTGSKKSPDSH